ncbi:hypothetical protein F5Y10DRAFT_272663 [Nemania abortiva]|nr:hypothetical protein F5Y10DRAFT_272663 [Nemania abortiva]
MGWDSFRIDVDWPATEHDNWVDTSSEVRNQTGIIRYRAYRNSGNWLYDYCLEIETERDDYKYHFTDGEPDTYGLESQKKGNHTVKYNSKSPGIRQVWGEDMRPPGDYDWSN